MRLFPGKSVIDICAAARGSEGPRANALIAIATHASPRTIQQAPDDGLAVGT